jgi:hypothetical protein
MTLLGVLLLTFVLHNQPDCGYAIVIDREGKGPQEVADIKRTCLPGEIVQVTDGVLTLTYPIWVVKIPLPSRTWTGWVRYSTGQNVAFLDGKRSVPVGIHLRDEI